VALLAAYYAGMDPRLGPETWTRFWIFFTAVHLFVAFGPFLRDGRSRSFWRYNHILFLRAALAGFLSLLLLHPLRGEGEPVWVRSFRRAFYPAQWPLMLLLAAVMAHDFRANGVRESGYLASALALWVTGISAYSFRGGMRLKLYPASLFAICMLCSFGPWGVLEVSWSSHVRLLRNHLAAHGMFRDGRIVPWPGGGA